MGIQLPAELTEVAARIGLAWPEADEDGMRVAAQAWRDAGTQLTSLAGDADATAQSALRAVDGPTGDAARRYWSTFINPDTGHLTASVRECAAAADRLEHAAHQIGAAKVEIVRHLIALARNTDAAQHAAAAGNPMAMVGLDTAVRGTAATVASITANLISAVQPVTGAETGVAGGAEGIGLAGQPAPLNAPDLTGPIAVQPDPLTPRTGVPIGQTAQAGFAPGAVEVAAPAANVASAQAHAAPLAGPGLFGGGQPPAAAFPLAPPGAGAMSSPGRPAMPYAGGAVGAVPPGPAVPLQADRSSSSATHRTESRGAVMAFWVHMFPIGHIPVVSHEPARQLPPPPPERDYAPGLRFEPGDHPRHDLVDSTDRLSQVIGGAGLVRPTVGARAGDPVVIPLAEGHDPLGGQHERAWDRRYLVRRGRVTATGISTDGIEYAWPPAEGYPEGGTAPGEAEVLGQDTVIDRFGTPEGRVFSAGATPFARRSLPPTFLTAGYRRYRVLRPLPVWRAVSAAWFGQPGGGERYRTTLSAIELQAMGYLAEITDSEGVDSAS